MIPKSEAVLADLEADRAGASPAATCAWCEAESGVRTPGSHTVCVRHGCMELLRFNVPVATVRDWALRQPNGELGFNAAVQLVALEQGA